MLKKLGRYEIEAEIGRGAMGVVYRAKHPRLRREVALKTMSASLATDAEARKRFQREADGASGLSHPNIVQIYDYDIDEAEGIPYIVMEYLEGQELRHLIENRAEIDIVRKLNIITEVCKGLHYAHQRGIVHRDVKPANVFVTNEGAVKILDFGIARMAQSTTLSRTGTVAGTVLYMSPEHFRAKVDARSDIFALGVILYELLTYQHPFMAPDIHAVMFNIISESPSPLSEYLPNCPPELERAILKAVEKDREARYQTAEDLGFELDSLASQFARQRVDVYLREAENALAQGNARVAKSAIQKVLDIDSHHSTARRLLSQILEQLDKEARTQRLQQAVEEGKQHIDTGDYEGAMAAFDQVLAQDAAHGSALRYRQVAAERLELKRKLNFHLSRAQLFANDGDFEAAKTELEALLAIDSNHSAALALMGRVRQQIAAAERMRQINELLAAARSRLQAKQFQDALLLLGSVGELDPGNAEVESLSAKAREGLLAQEREEKLRQRREQIQAALGQQDFQRAQALIDSGLRHFPAEPQLLRLRDEVERLAKARETELYVNAQVDAARALLRQKDYAGAIQVLEGATNRAPDEARLADLLTQAREAQRREEQELARRQASALLETRRFGSAIDLLKTALERTGRAPELEGLLKQAVAKQDEAVRRQQAGELLERARSLLAQQQYSEAIEILEQAPPGPGSEEIAALLPEARSQQAEVEEQHRQAERERQRRVGELLERARSLLAQQQYSGAIEILEQAPPELKSEEIAALLLEARSQQAALEERHRQAEQAEQAERERQRRIGELLERARRFIAQQQFGAAIKVLGQAPPELKSEEVAALLREARSQEAALEEQRRQAEQAERERQRRIGELLERARRFMAQQQFGAAIKALEQAPAELKSEEVAALLREARSQQAALEEQRRQAEQAERAERERRQRIGELLERARRLMAQQQFGAATKVLEQAPAELKSEEIAALLREARSQQAEVEEQRKRAEQAERAERERQRRIGELLERARRFMAQQRHGEAIKALEQAPAELKSEGIAALLREARSQQAALEEQRRQAERERPRAGAGGTAVVPAREPIVTPVPKPAPSPVAVWLERAKALPRAVFAGAGVAVLVVAILLVRWIVPSAGYVALTSVPPARVVSVKTAQGELVKTPLVGEETPVLLDLPPGDYVIELKKDDSEKPETVPLSVGKGDNPAKNYLFNGVKVDVEVEKLLKQQ